MEKTTLFPLRRIVLFFGGVIIGLLVLFIIVVYQYLSSFSVSSGLSFDQLWTLGTTAQHNQERFKNRKITFLILGLDKRNDEFEKTLLTDTIILASLNTENGKLITVPIPRDLWIPQLHTKVNALYFYGEGREGTTGSALATDEISRISGVPIDYFFVLNYQELPELINALDGIEVKVEQSFTDDQFPNPRFIEEASESGEPMYISVSFDAGKQWMDGNRALQYIRSRHSEGDEGSDASRSRRQALVVQSLISRIKQRETLLNPVALGNAYQFWKNRLETNMADSEIGALGLTVHDKDLSFTSVAIPVIATESQPAVLTTPPRTKYGLWVLEPVDPTWGELKNFLSMYF